ncbi:sialate O-acetylesterase [Luteimonas sp. S4-F44]|uniref:sialate O-acetylesterase n=1 Tax=Luteimonas sp. S4-F44 TaxID=2925842 RepID=UPI001F53AFFA|nr:sialate O-acetylesterase [Luteimonas sp. S4-F44]UNK41601.1 sialate O-acetylesterase [Luteimonas sp. S4-F44]
MNGRRRPTRPRVLLALLLLALAPLAHADTPEAALLHPLIQDHAVLQRDRPLRLQGEAPAGTVVHLTLADRRAQARADADGHWQAELPALPAGGPHTLTVRAGETTRTVRDLLVGDVWLCAGQSNMELQVWRSLDARAEIAGADAPDIRLLTVPQVSSPVPLARFTEPVTWQPVTPESVRDFSAACYYFARELRKTVDVPMGLIEAAWGGSRIQAWTSGEALRAGGHPGEDLDVLALYHTDPMQAAARWGERWAAWWLQAPGVSADDRPWTDTVSGDWREAPHALGAWERWGVPELATFDGMVWYRTSVRLTAAQAAQDATLLLGPADEMDLTWVNGTAVGSSYGAGTPRAYPLPPGLLRAGDNTIVVNVLDTYREGGLAGPESVHRLQLADGAIVPLDAGWRYRIVPPQTGAPPRAPWQSAAGLSTLYNGMIAPLGSPGLRGVVWYQGEANTGEAGAYANQLRGLRDDWRTRFGDPRLPWLVVQLPNYGAPNEVPGESGWATLREAQRRVAGEPRAALAVTIDLGEADDIHPANKQAIGRRLARAARHAVYGETLAPSGPVPRSARREAGAVVVTFDAVDGGLVAYGAPGPVGFELCGADTGSCRWAQAVLDGDRVRLQAPGVAAPVRVRYAWADNPLVNLFDRAGQPPGPFEIEIR